MDFRSSVLGTEAKIQMYIFYGDIDGKEQKPAFL